MQDTSIQTHGDQKGLADGPRFNPAERVTARPWVFRTSPIDHSGTYPFGWVRTTSRTHRLPADTKDQMDIVQATIERPPGGRHRRATRYP